MAAYTPYKRPKNADTPENTAKYYLTNSKLLPEVVFAKAEGRVTDKLAGMLLLLTRKYAQRPCFSGYTYKEDMISEALVNLCRNALKFKPEKSSNPFAFYSTCINNSFLQFLNVEKKQRKIRDKLLIDLGENPSYNFNDEYNAQQNSEYSSEIQELKAQIETAHQNVKKDAEYAAIAAEKEAILAAEAALLLLGEEIESEFIDDLIISDKDLDFKPATNNLIEFDK